MSFLPKTELKFFLGVHLQVGAVALASAVDLDCDVHEHSEPNGGAFEVFEELVVLGRFKWLESHFHLFRFGVWRRNLFAQNDLGFFEKSDAL